MLPDRKEVTPAERIVFNHVHIPDTCGNVWLDWRLLWHTNTALDSQYASQWDPGLIATGDKSCHGTLRSKRIVATLAWGNWGNYDVGLR